MRRLSKIIYISVAVLSVSAAVWLLTIYKKERGVSGGEIEEAVGYKNATFEIGGAQTKLGTEIQAVPGSAATVKTDYFGNESRGDLNQDGLEDVGFLITQTTGGSGVFYYAVVALRTASGYDGTNAVFLGDRVSPQNTEIRNGMLLVNYAERRLGEPMTVAPSMGKTKYLAVEGKKLFESPIFVEFPARGSAIRLPLSASGLARGSWFFEASFPIILKDASGKEAAVGQARAVGDWMTADYVRFSAVIEAKEAVAAGPAELIFKKDNPSGLIENDYFFRMPVVIEG